MTDQSTAPWVAATSKAVQVGVHPAILARRDQLVAFETVLGDGAPEEWQVFPPIHAVLPGEELAACGQWVNYVTDESFTDGPDACESCAAAITRLTLHTL